MKKKPTAEITTPELKSARNDIDKIDRQIALLVGQRLIKTKQIFLLKTALKIKLIDRKRETAVQNTYYKILKAKATRPSIKALAISIVTVSPLYPKKITKQR